MSELEAARIDVHHSAEQVAAINYRVEQAQAEMEKLIAERSAINSQFYEKCQRLAHLRERIP